MARFVDLDHAGDAAAAAAAHFLHRDLQHQLRCSSTQMPAREPAAGPVEAVAPSPAVSRAMADVFACYPCVRPLLRPLRPLD